MGANSFVAINEGMIPYQAETETSCFFKYGGVQILTGKSLEWGIECRVQKSIITDAV